jgi:hypothetical protein
MDAIERDLESQNQDTVLLTEEHYVTKKTASTPNLDNYSSLDDAETIIGQNIDDSAKGDNNQSALQTESGDLAVDSKA